MESLKKDRTTLLYFYQQVRVLYLSDSRVLLQLKCQGPREIEEQSPDFGGPSPGNFSWGHSLALGQLSNSAFLTAN